MLNKEAPHTIEFLDDDHALGATGETDAGGWYIRRPRNEIGPFATEKEAAQYAHDNGIRIAPVTSFKENCHAEQ